MEKSFLRSGYQRVIESLRYEGPHYLFLHLISVCLSPFGVLAMSNFFQKDLTEPLREIRAKVELTISQATESDLDGVINLVKSRYAYSRDLEWYSKLGIRDTILERLQRGCKCFVGKVGREVVHYNWIFFHCEEMDPGTGRFLHMKDDEALCNDGSTAEEWRGKSIHTAVNNQMLRFLQQTGYRRAYTMAGMANKSSKKGLYRVGWTCTGIIIYFLPRGREKCWIWWIRRPLDPFIGERIFSK